MAIFFSTQRLVSKLVAASPSSKLIPKLRSLLVSKEQTVRLRSPATMMINGQEVSTQSINKVIPLQERMENVNEFTAAGENILFLYLAKWYKKRNWFANREENRLIEEFKNGLHLGHRKRLRILSLLVHYDLVSKRNLELMMAENNENIYLIANILEKLLKLGTLTQKNFERILKHPNRPSLAESLEALIHKRRIIYALGFSKENEPTLSKKGVVYTVLTSLLMASAITVACAMIFAGGVITGGILYGLSIFFAISLFPTIATIWQRKSYPAKSTSKLLLKSHNPIKSFQLFSQLSGADKKYRLIHALLVNHYNCNSDLTRAVDIFKQFNITSPKHPLVKLFIRSLNRMNASNFISILSRPMLVPDGSISETVLKRLLKNVALVTGNEFRNYIYLIPEHLYAQCRTELWRILDLNLTAPEKLALFRRFVDELLQRDRFNRDDNGLPLEDANHRAQFGRQNTHLASVEHSISASAARLMEQFQARKSDFSKVRTKMMQWIMALDLVDKTKQEQVQQAMVRLSSAGYVEEQSQVSQKDLLALAWLAIHSNEMRDSCSLEDAKNHLIEALYESQTAYGIGRPACARGSFNKIVEGLKCAGIKGVDYVATTNEIVTIDFYKALDTQLQVSFERRLATQGVVNAEKWLGDLEEHALNAEGAWSSIRTAVKNDMSHHGEYIEKVARFAAAKNLDEFIELYYPHYEISPSCLEKLQAMLKAKKVALAAASAGFERGSFFAHPNSESDVVNPASDCGPNTLTLNAS